MGTSTGQPPKENNERDDYRERLQEGRLTPQEVEKIHGVEELKQRKKEVKARAAEQIREGDEAKRADRERSFWSRWF